MRVCALSAFGLSVPRLRALGAGLHCAAADVLLSVGGRAARPGASNGGCHDYNYRRAGMRVAHGAEKFESEGAPVPTIVTGGKLEEGDRPSAGAARGGRSHLWDRFVELGGLRRPFEQMDWQS